MGLQGCSMNGVRSFVAVTKSGSKRRFFQFCLHRFFPRNVSINYIARPL